MTDDHDRYADDLAAYALGALTELEARAFERHLMRCNTCARELEASRSAATALASAVPQHRAPADLKQAVMDAVRSESGVEPAQPPRRRLLRPRLARRPALALAGALGAVAVAVGGYGLGAAGTDDRDVLAATVDRTQLPDARAELVARGNIGVLRTSGLPQAPDGQVYVVWVDRGEGPAYASSFNVAPEGTAETGVDDLDDVERVMVTREPSTAVAHPSESPVLTVDLS